MPGGGRRKDELGVCVCVSSRWFVRVTSAGQRFGARQRQQLHVPRHERQPARWCALITPPPLPPAAPPNASIHPTPTHPSTHAYPHHLPTTYPTPGLSFAYAKLVGQLLGPCGYGPQESGLLLAVCSAVRATLCLAMCALFRACALLRSVSRSALFALRALLRWLRGAEACCGNFAWRKLFFRSVCAGE